MPPLPQRKPLTVLEQHRLNWKDCDRCDLANYRQKVVLIRGKVPCDLLFIGEAPGESEDSIGYPFVGPAGMLLDQMIAEAIPDKVRWAVTNLVACIPREKAGSKADQPLPEEIDACGDRLREIVAICSPKVLVCVGALARDYTDPKMKNSTRFPKPYPRIEVMHPAAILRMNLAQRGLAIKRNVVNIQSAVELLTPKV